MQGIILLTIIIAIIVVVIIKDIKSLKKDNTHEEPIQNEIPNQNEIPTSIPKQGLYSKKKYLTATEKEFYQKLLKAVEKFNVNVQAQINLASVIQKNNNSYRNELFRNVDFGIFDEDYNVILLIELNDRTHLQNSRRTRDNKVNEICNIAGIPIVTFWTIEDNTIENIQNCITEHIEAFGGKYSVKVV